MGTFELNFRKENEEVKKAHEEIEDKKTLLVDKDSLIKLQLDKISKLE